MPSAKKPLRDVVLSLAHSEHYLTVNTVLARILAAKPHSADAERLISSSNTLKTLKQVKYAFGHREYVPVRVLQHATFIWVGSRTSCFIMAQQAPPPRNRQTLKKKNSDISMASFLEASAKCGTFAELLKVTARVRIFCVMQKSKVKTF